MVDSTENRRLLGTKAYLENNLLKHHCTLNVVHHLADHFSDTIPLFHIFYVFSLQQMMLIQSKEARIIVAIESIRFSSKLSIRAAAKIYNVPYTTLAHGMKGRSSKTDYRPVAQSLTEIEEDVIVQNILDLNSRGFSPSVAGVRGMADYIFASRGAPRVGKQWPYRFSRRRDELRARFSRTYDFQRALCEDFELISAWFRLVSDMRVKYGILDCDLDLL